MIMEKEKRSVDKRPIEILEIPDDLSEVDKAFVVLRANGFSKKKAYEIASGKTDFHPSTPNAKEKAIRSRSIVNPELVDLAHKAIQDTLTMTPQDITRTVVTKEGDTITFKDKLYPSHSNKLDAAKMIVDRDEPAVQKHMNLNVNADVGIELVDLKAYRDLPNEPEVVRDVDVCDVTDANPTQL